MNTDSIQATALGLLLFVLTLIAFMAILIHFPALVSDARDSDKAPAQLYAPSYS